MQGDDSMMKSSRNILIILLMSGFHLAAHSQDDIKRIEKLSTGADVILTGKVKEKKSAWNEQKTRIYTKTTVQVDEILKGDGSANSVEISTLGGEVDGIGELYTHLPTFRENEEVLVFLKFDAKQKEYNIFQGQEGKINIVNDEKTKQKRTSSNISLESLKSQIKRFVTIE